MNTIWMLILLTSCAIETVPMAFPTQEACHNAAQTTIDKLGKGIRAACVERDGDR